MLWRHAILACLALTLVTAGAPTSWAADAAPRADLNGKRLIVYGHSWTVGSLLPDPASRYTRLLADEYGLEFSDTIAHSRGVNGSLVHAAMERAFGSPRRRASWVVGTDALVLVHANLNSLRDYGADPRAVRTSLNSLRTMLATFNATSRIEESTQTTLKRSRSWRLSSTTSKASGGRWIETRRTGAWVEFRATGGEYVALRGRAWRGVRVRVRDRDGRTTLRRLNLSRQVHPGYDTGTGITYVYQVPESAAGHRIRLVRAGGVGKLAVDVILPQRLDPNPVVLVKEPYLNRYDTSAKYLNGSHAAVDAFNAVVDKVAAEFPNVIVADPDSAGYWDSTTMLLEDGTHPNEAGNVALMRTVADAIDQAAASPVG